MRGLLFGGAFGVPMRRAGVEVPAVVVEGAEVGDGRGRPSNNRAGARRSYPRIALGDQGPDFVDRFAFEMQKTDDDIGNLDAGVIDVVLHVDFVTGLAQQTDKRVAENRIPQMPDVCGLVGIDRGVFDQRMALRYRRTGVPHARHVFVFVASMGFRHYPYPRGPVQPRVDIPGAGHVQRVKPTEWAERFYYLLRDDFGGFAQRARQLQGDGRRDLAKAQIGRRFERDVLDFECVFFFEERANCAAEPLLQFEIHRVDASKMLDFTG